LEGRRIPIFGGAKMLIRKLGGSARAVAVLLLTVAVITVSSYGSTASAHIALFDTTTIESGWYGTLKFRVPHGCGHEGIIGATSVFSVDIPEGVVIVKPEDLAGWNSSVESGPVAPWINHGVPSTEGPIKVIWTADPGSELLNVNYKDFGMHVMLGDQERQPLGLLYFKSYQTCIDGDTNFWA